MNDVKKMRVPRTTDVINTPRMKSELQLATCNFASSNHALIRSRSLPRDSKGKSTWSALPQQPFPPSLPLGQPWHSPPPRSSVEASRRRGSPQPLAAFRLTEMDAPAEPAPRVDMALRASAAPVQGWPIR